MQLYYKTSEAISQSELLAARQALNMLSMHSQMYNWEMELKVIRPSKGILLIFGFMLAVGTTVLILTIFRSFETRNFSFFIKYWDALIFVSLLFILFPLWIVSMKLIIEEGKISYRTIFTKKVVEYSNIGYISTRYSHSVKGGRHLYIDFLSTDNKRLFTIQGSYFVKKDISTSIRDIMNQNPQIRVEDNAGIMQSIPALLS